MFAVSLSGIQWLVPGGTNKVESDGSIWIYGWASRVPFRGVYETKEYGVRVCDKRSVPTHGFAARRGIATQSRSTPCSSAEFLPAPWGGWHADIRTCHLDISQNIRSTAVARRGSWWWGEKQGGKILRGSRMFGLKWLKACACTFFHDDTNLQWAQECTQFILPLLTSLKFAFLFFVAINGAPFWAQASIWLNDWITDWLTAVVN